jgi:L-threonylcarbamoyladenylate synthase
MVLPDNTQTRSQAAAIISRGGIIAFRTDTFYGLGVDPLNESAVRRLRELKGREEAKPILVLIADRDDAERFIAEQSELFQRVAAGYWPGPLTLVGVAHPSLSDELTSGSGTIGVRLPADESVRDLIRACGGALTGTSANLSAQPPSCSAREVAEYFPTGVDLIIDGGEVNVSEPSTVLDLSGPAPGVIREGAIAGAALQELFRNA